MKKIFKTLTFVAVTVFGFGWTANAQNANVQVIHNCADPAAAVVDIWVDGGLGQQLLPDLDNLAFRHATPFLSVPSGVPLTAYVKGPNSLASDPALATFVLGALAPSTNYTITAAGVVGGGFAANPDALSIAFDLKTLTPSRQASVAGAGFVDFTVFHGATDAPGVDVRVRSGGPLLVDNLRYGSYSPYFTAPAGWYQLEVITEDSSAVVNTYIANLSGLSGQAVTILASGFLDSTANNNGRSFGLFAVLTNGTVVELPVRQTATIQLIHNAADPALNKVDVYINGAKFFDNFQFRQASPALGIMTANFPINVGFAPENSTTVADTIWSNTYFFSPGETYVAMARGNASQTGFASNPNGRSTDFDVSVLTPSRLASVGGSGTFDFSVFHGASDAGGVDVRVRSGGPLLVNNAKYGDFSPFLSVPTGYYALEVINEDSSGAPITTVIANLSNLGGQAGIVFASGYADSTANNNGRALGIFLALPSGQVIQLPVRQTATVQLLHNSSDTAARTVDVYINGVKYFDDFAYRTASPALGIMTADFPISIGIAPGNSTSFADTFWHRVLFFSPNTFYVATASGLVGSGYAANPDSRSTAFDVLIKSPAQLNATGGNFDFFAIHGATDAPTVDVKVRGAGTTLVNDAAYGDQTAYISVPAASYVLDVTNAAGSTVVASYVADVTTLANNSGIVLASGFLNPAANKGGAPFGLFLVTPAGGAFTPLPLFVGINELNEEIELSMYPNPNSGSMYVNFNLKETSNLSIDITNLNGQVVKTIANGSYNSGAQFMNIDLSDLSNGMYFTRIITNGKVSNNKFTLNK
jgi:hypothetical protein